MQDTATPVRLAAISGGDPALREAVALRLAAEGFALADDLTAAAALDALIILAEAKAQSFAGTSTADFSAHMGGQLKAAFVALQSGVAAIRAKGGGGAVVVLAPQRARTGRLTACSKAFACSPNPRPWNSAPKASASM